MEGQGITDIIISENDPKQVFDLLLIDFAGVCTPTHRELVSAGSAATVDASSSGEVIRPSCDDVVARAQHNGILVAILSNEVDCTWAESTPFLARVDQIFACTDNGILKPDRRAYERALLITGCRAERTLFVDDTPDNVTGAAGTGMHSLLFDVGHPDDCWSEIAARLGLAPSSAIDRHA